MSKVRHLINIITGIAGIALVIVALYTPENWVSHSLLRIFALIGLFRLNLATPQQKKEGTFPKLHFAGLSLVIIALVLLYVNIAFGHILMIVGAILVALYQLTTLFKNEKVNFINILHLLVYLVGLIYVLQMQHWIRSGFTLNQLMLLLNLFIFLTLFIVGGRDFFRKEKTSIDMSDTPIDFPEDSSL